MRNPKPWTRRSPLGPLASTGVATALAFGAVTASAAPPTQSERSEDRAPTPTPKVGELDVEREWTARPGEPGSGVPREDNGKADPAKLKAPELLRPRDESEGQGIDELEELMERYRDATEATNDTLRSVLVVETDKGKEQLAKHYDKEIEDHQSKVRLLRESAIERYQEFIARRPDDPIWTPEIMFRLADLHFQAASERFRRTEEIWEEKIAEIEERRANGETIDDDAVPPSPELDYHASLGLFSDVVQRFPNYAHNDAALYMMGVLFYEEEDFDGSRQAFLALTCKNRFEVPNKDGSNRIATYEWQPGDYKNCDPVRQGSKHVTEAWLRTGEVHYDLDELEPALEAYIAAMEDPANELFSAALIRLAWTLYLNREFAKAVGRFDQFVRYADTVKGTDEGSGAAEFRGEAISYIAKCYVEEDWDLDGRFDKIWGLDRLDSDYADRGDEAHVPEIYMALGDLLAFQTDFYEAVRIWELALSRWPNTPKAPMLQLKILQAYDSMQDPDGASKARDALATNYLRGTPWFLANQDNPDAIEEAMKLAEDALVATAVDHHTRAQALRASGEEEGAKVEYAIAAKAYEAYLERFPDTPSSYEYRYQFAESLYYSDQFLPAAEQFMAVRDSNIDNRLQADASESTVAALESYVEQQENLGKFVMPAMPKLGPGGERPKVEELALPELAVALQEAYDRDAQIRPNASDIAETKFKAGEISQKYHDFEDSERRFVAVLEQHCAEPIAVNAGYAIIDAHVVRNDLEGTAEWTTKLGEMGCGGSESKEFAGKLKTINHAVRFEEAKQLADAGKYEAAADRYVALVDEAPNDPNADLALYNAAVSYERIGRFGSASKTYQRIFETYDPCKNDADGKPIKKPNAKKQCSEWSDDALLRTGFNHARFFEFEEAVSSYEVLAEDEKYADSEFRLVALKNAAGLLDNLQDYKRSAKLYRKTAEKAKTEAERAEASFRAAEVTAKTGDATRTRSAFRQYLKKFGKLPTEGERELSAHLAIGNAYREEGERKKAIAEYEITIARFKARGLEASTKAADFPAEAQFRIAEYHLADVDRVKLTGTGKKFQKSAKNLFDKIIKTAADFDAVFPYRRLEWTLAAMYLRGFGFENVAIKVRRAPVPKQLKPDSEAWFAYKDLVAEQMQPFEDKAVSLYEETVNRSKQFKISNKWTQQAKERLNLYKPDQYPLLREPALQLDVEDRR